MKESKRYAAWRICHLHPSRQPEAISVAHFDQSDFERARWVWQRRPKRRFAAFWRTLACIMAPAVAAPFLHLPQPFADILVAVSGGAGFVLWFGYSRELDKWSQWRADYSRAMDRLLSRSM
jgi:hypothetical protein